MTFRLNRPNNFIMYEQIIAAGFDHAEYLSAGKRLQSEIWLGNHTLSRVVCVED